MVLLTTSVMTLFEGLRPGRNIFIKILLNILKKHTWQHQLTENFAGFGKIIIEYVQGQGLKTSFFIGSNPDLDVVLAHEI